MLWSINLSLIILFHFSYIFAWDFNNNDCNNYRDYSLWFISPNCKFNPDVRSDARTLAKRHGYNLETHSLTTENGYILNIFRIPPKQDDNRKSKQPIFIHHGVLTNAAVWLDIGNQSLAFVLANSGYDVWLGNLRGTTYSRQHKTLDVTNKKYWDFNLDNVVKYDITKQLKYIASITKQSGNIIFIGHSMGTTVAMMYASEYNKEANDVLRGIIGLAPPIYFHDIPILSQVAPFGEAIKNSLNSIGITGLFYQEKLIHRLTSEVCRVIPYVCRDVLVPLFGKMTDQFLPNYLLLFYSYYPSGIAVDMLVQYAQIAASGNFAKYDYGDSRNAEIYGQLRPPKYELSKIRLPVYLMYGKNDAVATEKNVLQAYKEIGSEEKYLKSIPVFNNTEAFNHLNFMYAKDIDKLLYETIFSALTRMQVQ